LTRRSLSSPCGRRFKRSRGTCACLHGANKDLLRTTASRSTSDLWTCTWTGMARISRQRRPSGVSRPVNRAAMIEMIFQSGQSLAPGEAGQSEYVRKIRDLREAAQLDYHRIELNNFGPKKIPASASNVWSTRRNRVRRICCERSVNCRFTSAKTQLWNPSRFFAGKSCRPPSDGTVLVEYYSAGDRLVRPVVTRETIESYPSPSSRVSPACCNLLRFQLRDFAWASGYTQRLEQPLLLATCVIWKPCTRNSSHLGELISVRSM